MLSLLVLSRYNVEADPMLSREMGFQFTKGQNA